MSEHRELVAIVAATEQEIAALRERVRDSEIVRNGPYRYQVGTVRGVNVAVASTGDGKRNADLGIRRLIQKLSPTRVLAIGHAGALSEDLAPGDLLVSSEVLEGQDTIAWPDLQWLEDADIPVPHELGRLVTVDEILVTADEKRRWWGHTWRDQPAAADMESACFARVAAAYRVPYLIVRFISASAAEMLPGFLEDCRAQDGSLDRRQVMWRALVRPKSWLPLLILRARIRRGSVSLADFAEALVGSLA
jgi:nucleoside phosphorylase